MNTDYILHVLHLGKYDRLLQYASDGCRIDTAQNVSDLGVDIDCNLIYDTHINIIIGKTYARVSVFFNGFASSSQLILRQAFITYVRPVLEYASSVWSPYLLKHINDIEKLQKRFTGYIYSIPHLSYPERLAAIDLEPLELRMLKIIWSYIINVYIILWHCLLMIIFVNNITFLRLHVCEKINEAYSILGIKRRNFI